VEKTQERNSLENTKAREGEAPSTQVDISLSPLAENHGGADFPLQPLGEDCTRAANLHCSMEELS